MKKLMFICLFVFVLTIVAAPSLAETVIITTEDKGINWIPADEPTVLPSYSTSSFILPNPNPPPNEFKYEIEFYNLEIGGHATGRSVHCWNVIYAIVPDEGPVEENEYIRIVDIFSEGDEEGFLHGVDEDFNLSKTTLFGYTQDWTATPFVVDDLTVYLAGADLSPFGETTGRFFVSEFYLPYRDVHEPPPPTATTTTAGAQVSSMLNINSLSSEAANLNFKLSFNGTSLPAPASGCNGASSSSYGNVLPAPGDHYLGESSGGSNHAEIFYHADVDFAMGYSWNFDYLGFATNNPRFGDDPFGLGMIYVKENGTTIAELGNYGIVGNHEGSGTFNLLAGNDYTFQTMFYPNILGDCRPCDGTLTGDISFSFVPEPPETTTTTGGTTTTTVNGSITGTSVSVGMRIDVDGVTEVIGTDTGTTYASVDLVSPSDEEETTTTTTAEEPPATADAYEPDNFPADATPIADGQTQSHTIHTDGDVDWLAVTLQAECVLTVETVLSFSGSNADTVLELYDNNCNALAYDDDGGSDLASLISYTATYSGVYYIKAQTFGGSYPNCNDQGGGSADCYYDITVTACTSGTTTTAEEETTTTTVETTTTTTIGVVIPIIEVGGSQVALPEGPVRMQFQMGIASDQGNPEIGLFPNLILTTSDVGRTFTVDGNNPYFYEYVQYITDGIDGTVGYGYSWPDGIGGTVASYTNISESQFFLGIPPNGIDFQGYLIDSFTLSINSLIFDVPGSNPNGDGNWVDYEIDMSLSFVPEPAETTTTTDGTTTTSDTTTTTSTTTTTTSTPTSTAISTSTSTTASGTTTTTAATTTAYASTTSTTMGTTSTTMGTTSTTAGTTTTTATGCTCDAGCDGTTISLPFTKNGSGEYCWKTTDNLSTVNSWNTNKVEINNQDYTNTWSNSFPAKIDGKYYIYYKSSVSWGHFEAAGGGTTTTTAGTTTTAASGCTCDSGCNGSSISPDFTKDGAGQFCWRATSGTYINSWNMNKLTVNGVDFTGKYAFTSQLPAKINGKWYIYYDGSYPWSHFELKN